MLNWWLPENVSTYGAEIDWLFELIYYITGATFVLVAVAMITFLIMYRARPGRKARYTHGNTSLEIVWTVVPALILIVLTFLSVPAWSRIKMHIPDSDVQIRITAKQFNWEVTYPGPDGTFDTADDRTFDNEIHFPVGKPIVIHLRSKDVIHSFFLPQFRLKQDAVPGMTIDVWLQATRTGTFEIACAELCGFGHATMRGQLTVHEPGEYRAWLQEAQTAAAAQAGAGAVLPAAKPPA